MTIESAPYEGITAAEAAAFTASSQIRPGEDHSTWAARAAREAEEMKSLLAKRRAVAAEAPAKETPTE